jgi:signal peptidase I
MTLPPSSSTPATSAADHSAAAHAHGNAASGATAQRPATAPPQLHEKTQIKETLISIIIAFILAFVARAFVIEAFIIPTGSMAPTLMGAHVRLTSPNTGYDWPVGPATYTRNNIPTPLQGPPQQPLTVHDPMTGERFRRQNERLRSGDRILVFKYLYSVYDPKRFDVVVFKAPHEPQTNYIKRLVGLPGEQLALIDGDVFTRTPAVGERLTQDQNAWELPGWQIQRKPERAQRELWQPVFSSEYEPINNNLGPPVGIFRSPWVGGDQSGSTGWAIDGRRSYIYSGAGPTILRWDSERWPIDDEYAYNETLPQNPPRFPVSDIATSLGIEPAQTPLAVAAILRARGHEFRADIDGTTVTLRIGALVNGDAPNTWQTLGTGQLTSAIAPGRITQLEFWHYDQRLELWADDRLIARGEYNWTPEERLNFATTISMDRLMETGLRGEQNPLIYAANYTKPEVRWEFIGGGMELHRVGLARDIHYQSVPRMTGEPARATHPLYSPFLGPDHFFVCGDNSPASSDSRLWDEPDPWVAARIDATEGIVPRDLMIGRAFFVYFPAMPRNAWTSLPMPDFGRLRWIW